MANCINYNAQHPAFKNRMDAAIRKQLLKGCLLISQSVSDSDIAGQKFRVDIVKFSNKEKCRYSTVAHVRFNSQHQAVVTVQSNMKMMGNEQMQMYYR